jgi:hypothetical protein
MLRDIAALVKPAGFADEAAWRAYLWEHYMEPRQMNPECTIPNALLALTLDDMAEITKCLQIRAARAEQEPAAPPAEETPADTPQEGLTFPNQDPDPFAGDYLDEPVPDDWGGRVDMASKLLLALGVSNVATRNAWYSDHKLPMPAKPPAQIGDATLLRVINIARDELRAREKGEAA